MAGISVLLIWLDPVLAAIVLAGFVPLLLLTRWFRRGLAGQLPAHPDRRSPG